VSRSRTPASRRRTRSFTVPDSTCIFGNGQYEKQSEDTEAKNSDCLAFHLPLKKGAVIKSRLKSIPSDVQLNDTAQKLQAQATLIKRLLQENLQLINKEAVATQTLKKVKLEKEELETELSEIQNTLKSLRAEVDKAKQETEQEKLETAGVRQQLDAAILEKSDLEKQLQASEQIRSVEVNKIREELCETQHQLKAAKKRCVESVNSLTAVSSLEKQRINTYASYSHLQHSNQMFPVYNPRRAYAVSSPSPTPIQIVSPAARTIPPKAIWSNYQNTNPTHDNRRRPRRRTR